VRTRKRKNPVTLAYIYESGAVKESGGVIWNILI
jgi:hypothetical protein